MADQPSDASARSPRKKAPRRKAKARPKGPPKKKTPARKKAAPRKPVGRKRRVKTPDDPWFGLSEKHVELCEALLADPRRNGTRAYKALNPDAGDHTAAVEASKFLARPDVQSYLDMRTREISARLEVSPERVLAELAKLAFSNIGDVLAWSGGEITIEAYHQMPAEVKASIQELSERVDADGNRLLKVKIADKRPALETLARVLDMMRPDTGDTGPALVVNNYN